MSEDANPLSAQAQLLEDARRVSIKSQVEQLRIIQRLKETTECPVAGAADCVPAGTVGRLAAVGDLAFDLARLQITTYDHLLRMSSKHTDRIVDDLRRTFRMRRQAPVPVVRPVLELAGTIAKDEAVACFEVENRRAVGVRVTFSVSEFQGIDGGELLTAAVEFKSKPPATTPADDRCIPAGGRRTFEMQIKPLAPPFEAGHSYLARIYVVTDGCVGEALPLHLVVKP